mmetsp:Transcript_4255/g.10098  ORF Transcript_4255/g.10098 Transcript_4255/m.10098 type:complete len:116 (+) Transcript_4255:28-375(+)
MKAAYKEISGTKGPEEGIKVRREDASDDKPRRVAAPTDDTPGSGAGHKLTRAVVGGVGGRQVEVGVRRNSGEMDEAVVEWVGVHILLWIREAAGDDEGISKVRSVLGSEELLETG